MHCASVAQMSHLGRLRLYIFVDIKQDALLPCEDHTFPSGIFRNVSKSRPTQIHINLTDPAVRGIISELPFSVVSLFVLPWEKSGLGGGRPDSANSTHALRISKKEKEKEKKKTIKKQPMT